MKLMCTCIVFAPFFISFFPASALLTAGEPGTDLTSQDHNMTIRTVQPDVRYIEEFRNGADLNDGQQQRLGSQANSSKSGVTIYPASHSASVVRYQFRSSDGAQEILASLAEEEDHAEIIQSSFPDGAPEGFISSPNGFVNTAIRAYSTHHHLRIRPEDIWLAILTQLSSYINAHAEELRGSFVSHQGKKKLEIVYSSGSRYTVDWADFAENIGRMIQDNVVDPDLRQWVLPAFSTTTEQDVVVASIVMMASMQNYFDYGCMITCGLPSVTLLGQKEDYELILHRLDKLRSYGEEPTQFANLLTPIIKRFIRSFDDPKSEETLDFWNRIVTSWNMGSGADHYSGWITAVSKSKDTTHM